MIWDIWVEIKIFCIVSRLSRDALGFIVLECRVVNDCHILENNEKLDENLMSYKAMLFLVQYFMKYLETLTAQQQQAQTSWRDRRCGARGRSR